MEKKFKSQKEEREIFKQSSVYSFSLFLRMLLGLLRGIIVAKLLGPSLYGLGNAFRLVLGYEAYSDLGMFSAMNREAPYYRSAKNEEKAQQIVKSVFGINLIYSLFVGTILILISFYLRKTQWEAKYVDFVLFLGFLIITNKLRAFYSIKLKIDKKFYLLSKVEVLYGFASSIACVLFAYYLGFKGLLIGLFVADVIYIGAILVAVREIPGIGISFSIVRELLKIGFPIQSALFLIMSLASADRIIIVSMLSEEALGYYGIAVVATGVISIIPSAIHSVTLPRIMEKLGSTKNIYRIKDYLIEPTTVMAYFMPFLFAIIYFGIHLPVQYFLPKYMLSINIAKILTLGSFFLIIHTMPVSICYALNKQLKVVYMAFPAVLLNIVINVSVIRLGWGLNGVAFGTCISYFAFSTAIVWYTLKQFEVKTKETLRFFILIYSPFFYALSIFLTMDHFMNFKSFGFWNDVISTAKNIGIFSLIYVLIFSVVRKQSAIIKLIDNLKCSLPFTKKILNLFTH